MPSCVDYEYIAQNIDNNKLLYQETKNGELVLTEDINKAHIFDLQNGSKFLAENSGKFILKTKIRVKREQEYDKRTN